MAKRALSGPRIQPPAITGKESLTDLVDRVFTAYNSARLREAAQLLRKEILGPDVTVASRSRARSRRPGSPPRAWCR